MRLPSQIDCLAAKAARRTLASMAFLLGLSGVASVNAMPARAGSNEASSSRAASLSKATSNQNAHFAIADFDGDLKPDLATVEVLAASSSLNSRYSIRFELSASGVQSFGVTAPTGGLQIVARDVNGDNFLDLLVSTAWQNKAVAVLLNDGHGNFTLVEPEAFPASIWGNESGWNSEPKPRGDSAALLRSQNADGDAEEMPFASGPRRLGFVNQAGFHNSSRFLLFSLLGRAPPPFVLQA